MVNGAGKGLLSGWIGQLWSAFAAGTNHVGGLVRGKELVTFDCWDWSHCECRGSSNDVGGRKGSKRDDESRCRGQWSRGGQAQATAVSGQRPLKEWLISGLACSGC